MKDFTVCCWAVSLARSVVWSDIVTTVSHKLLEQS